MFPQLSMGGSVGISEFIGTLRPDSDISTTGWASTPLWSKLDETTPDDATTEIEHTWAEYPNEETVSFEVGLNNPSDPPAGTETVTVRFRDYLEFTGDPSLLSRTVYLREGAVDRATDVTSFWGPASYTTDSFVLSTSEVESVTDWNNVKIKMEYSGTLSSGTTDATVWVTWIEVEFS